LKIRLTAYNKRHPAFEEGAVYDSTADKIIQGTGTYLPVRALEKSAWKVEARLKEKEGVHEVEK